VGEVFDHALQGVDCQNFEFLVHSKDGRHVELLLNAASRRNAGGQIVGVTGVGQDITEKKYIEKAQINAAKMRASNDAKGNFLASMSHEMRTPLNGVLGMLQLAMSHELPPQVWRHVQNAYMSGEHLLNLVNDILDVSKIEAGKLELETKLFNLHDVFSTAMGIVKPQATHKGLALKLMGLEGFPKYARGDQQRTRQVASSCPPRPLRPPRPPRPPRPAPPTRTRTCAHSRSMRSRSLRSRSLRSRSLQQVLLNLSCTCLPLPLTLTLTRCCSTCCTMRSSSPCTAR
jgi:hypothetical protein